MLNTDEFLPLLKANQKRIYAFILSMVPNYVDADDLFQETILIMWSKFETFEPGTNFAAWGVTIAKYVILNSAQRKATQNRYFKTSVQEKLSEKTETYLHSLDDRMHALRQCIAKLDIKDHRLVEMRYEHEIDVQTLSQRLGLSAKSIYKRLALISDRLMYCVQRTLKQEDLA